MTVSLVPLNSRAVVGTLVMPDDSQPSTPKSYRDIADANDHLHQVLKALIKERSGQPLTETERRLIDLHIAAQRWQLEHTNMETS